MLISQNLFAFGDEDGKGIGAKIQHPLDVCHIPNTDYAIICDSYNHKVSECLKVINQVVKRKYLTSLREIGHVSLGTIDYK